MGSYSRQADRFGDSGGLHDESMAVRTFSWDEHLHARVRGCRRYE